MKNPAALAIIIIAAALLTCITVAYDYQILSAVGSVQNPVIDVAMIIITNIATLYIGVPIIVALIYFSKRRKMLWDLGAALAIGLVLVVLIKMLIARPRPEDISNLGFWVSAELSSFPSDHAATAFLMFGVIGNYLKKYRCWFYLLAVLIGISRIYLGAHYPTDVLAGAFIGIAVSQLVIKYKLGSALRKMLKRK